MFLRPKWQVLMEIGWVCVGEGEVGRGPRQLVKHHRVYSGGNSISRCKMAARGGVCSNFPTDYIDLLWAMLTGKMDYTSGLPSGPLEVALVHRKSHAS